MKWLCAGGQSVGSTAEGQSVVRQGGANEVGWMAEYGEIGRCK